ncbi:hypothetical protein K9N68_06980 [Kovacikia minuta CCNUW1]|uniref:hypothetical protein n=1 Tax=Kovacikia minuta TaxID=2931930 RepID=UPI001CCAB572|nr:hypothetical protein [Kovacikia minuta]UBF27656.1 hypothetical protein K9N68_06980 [Kovacikia minuta CCNUW1]
MMRINLYMAVPHNLHLGFLCRQQPIAKGLNLRTTPDQVQGWEARSLPLGQTIAFLYAGDNLLSAIAAII